MTFQKHRSDYVRTAAQPPWSAGRWLRQPIVESWRRREGGASCQGGAAP